MKNIIFASFLASIPLWSACGSKIDDLKSERATSNIEVVETNGVVTGTIRTDAMGNQVLVGSTASKAADVSVIFPPGSLAVNTEISIGEASNQSTQILGEIGLSGLVQSGDPVYIGPAVAGATVAVTQPLTVLLPLPVGTLNGTGLIAVDSKLLVIYTIFQNGTWVSGSIPIDSSFLVGALIRLSFQGLGYFQVVYLAAPGVQKEAPTAVRPILGRNETPTTGTDPAETPDATTTALSDYRGFYAGKVTNVSNTAVPGATGNGSYCTITNESFKLWLSPYDILVFKVSTPIAGNNSADFDGYVPSFGDITSVDPANFQADATINPTTAAITDAGVFNTTGVKFAVSDFQAQKSFKILLAGGFSGTTARGYTGTLTAQVGGVKVCEYSIDVKKL